MPRSGNTVKVASRMESTGIPGRIHISAATHRAVSSRFEVEPRGVIELEAWGDTNAFFLAGPATG